MLGAQLRRLREAAGISPDQAGYEIRASRSKISRLEHRPGGLQGAGTTRPAHPVRRGRTRDEGPLAMPAAGERHGWWPQFGDITPDWLETYLGLEAAAAMLRPFDLQFVHVLFQTEEWPASVTRPPWWPVADIDRRVSLRMGRQQLLTSPARRVWSVMDEAALRRPVGGGAVMRGHSTAAGSRELAPGHRAGRAVPPGRARGRGRLV